MRILYYHILHFFWRYYDSIDEALQGTYTRRILILFWNLFSDLWYFVLIGAVAAVALSRLLPRSKVSDFLRTQGKIAIPLATLLGIVSPISTFAAIPLVGALLSVGVPAPPLMAFLVSSPLMNPSLFILTAGALGTQMALARLISAALLGISAGIATHVLEHRRILTFSTLVNARIAEAAQRDGTSYPSTCSLYSRLWGATKGFLNEFRRFMTFIGKYFLLSLFIAAVVQAVLSPEWITRLLGTGSRFSILLAVALGIPLYACGGGSVPIIEVLMRMGMSPGAALAFFLAGPATKFSTIITLNAVLKRQVMVLYLIIMLGGATLLGYGYALIAPETLQTPPYRYDVEDMQSIYEQ